MRRRRGRQRATVATQADFPTLARIVFDLDHRAKLLKRRYRAFNPIGCGTLVECTSNWPPARTRVCCVSY